MPKFAANLTMLFGELPFLDRFAAAKAAGFSGVEYLFPYDFDKAELREQLHQHGLDPGAAQSARGQLGRRRARHRHSARSGRGVSRRRRARHRLRQGARLPSVELPGRHRARWRRYGRAQRSAGRQSALCRRCACQGTDQASDRADQHARYSRLLPERDRTGGSDHRRRAIEQSVRAVRYLPHAGDGGRHRAKPAEAPGRASPMSSSPTIPAATSPAPARSTIPSCSGISTLSVIAAGSGANTSRGRRRSTASDGTPR